MLIGWDFPAGVAGRLQDVILGSLRDLPMTGSGSFVESNPSVFTKFRLTITYVPVPSLPDVATGIPKDVTSRSAVLSGTVNPRGEPSTYHFDYGLTTAYGSATPAANAGSGNSPWDVREPVDGLVPRSTYHFRLVASSPSGTSLGEDKTFETLAVASAPDGSSDPVRDPVLAQNYPNPFNPSTTIRFRVPERRWVRLAVSNALGEEVAELVNGEVAAGAHEVTFTPQALPSGIYFCRLSMVNAVLVRKLTLVR